jgi:carboxypeptidase PM20D1
LVVVGTDSRYYRELTKNIFRFVPFLLDKSDLELMHGVNEKLSYKNVRAALNFYKDLITTC